MLAGQRTARPADGLALAGGRPRSGRPARESAIRSARAGGGGAAAAASADAPSPARSRWGRRRSSACFTSGSRSSRWRSSARAAGPEPRQQGEPGLRGRAAPGRSAAPRSTALSSAKKASRSGRDRAARQRPRRLAADRGIDRAARLAQQGEGAVATRSSQPGRALGEQVDELAPLRRPPVRPVGGLRERGRDPVVETHRRGVTAARAGAEAPYWPRRKVGTASAQARVLDSQSSQSCASSARSPPVTARNAASASARCPASASAAPSRTLTRPASSPPFCSAAR